MNPKQEEGPAKGTRFLQGWMVQKSLLSGFEVVVEVSSQICCFPLHLREQHGEKDLILPLPGQGGWLLLRE